MYVAYIHSRGLRAAKIVLFIHYFEYHQVVIKKVWQILMDETECQWDGQGLAHGMPLQQLFQSTFCIRMVPPQVTPFITVVVSPYTEGRTVYHLSH